MRRLLYSFLVVCLGLWLSCGKGTNEPETGYTTGENINTAWSVSTSCAGDYQGGTNIYTDLDSSVWVYIASNVITPCANVKQVVPPVFTLRVTALPSSFRINASEGEVNATSTYASYYATGYDFQLSGTSNFMTDSTNNVSITGAFDTSKAPGANSTNTFIRMLNPDDNSLVDLHGTVSGNQITVKLFGLPQQFTAAVIYNPNMTDWGAVSSSTASSSSWPAQRWCAVYNWKNSYLLAAAVAMGYAATPAGVQSAVTELICNAAVTAENSYGTAGFDAPNLYISSGSGEPCGSGLYNIVINSPGPSFAYDDYGQVIRPENNVYGRLFIDPNRMDDLQASPLGSSLAAVAQEMFYPIADAYLLYSSATTKGIREGMATTYGMTIDNDDDITVRSADPDETKMMSDFVNVNERSSSDVVSHANQDLFAYLAKAYGSDKYDYIENMFSVMQSWLSDASTADKYMPPRSQLYSLMSSSFSNTLGKSLNTAFLSFIEQRLFEHNTNSQLRTGDPSTPSFSNDLMEENSVDDKLNSVAEVLIDASDCSISIVNYPGTSQGGFDQLAPYAARAINITPANTSASGVTVKVTLSPGVGTFGNGWDGYNFVNNAVTGSVSSTNTFSDFGKTMTDQIVLLPVNISTYQTFIEYSITCTL